MKIKFLITYLIILLLFVSCSSYQNEMAFVSVNQTNLHATCELSTTCVPKHSFIKATIVPEAGYTIYNIKNTASLSTYYYKSEEEDNTYYILVNETNNILDIQTSDNKQYDVNVFWKTNPNYSVSFSSRYDIYSGDKVTFTVTPDSGYYVDLTCIKIKKYWSSDSSKVTVLLTQDENNPNNFSFIMPNYDVSIEITPKLIITPVQEYYSFELGENVVISLENHSSNETFDVKLNNGYKNSNDIELSSNITLTDSYEIPSSYFTEESQSGNYSLKIYLHGTFTIINSINFDINLPGIPEGWTTIGIKNNNSQFSNINWSNFYISTSKYTYSSLNVKYKFTKDNSSDVYEKENQYYIYSNQSFTFIENQLSTLKNSYDKFYIWIEDANKKIISRKIVYNTN